MSSFVGADKNLTVKTSYSGRAGLSVKNLKPLTEYDVTIVANDKDEIISIKFEEVL